MSIITMLFPDIETEEEIPELESGLFMSYCICQLSQMFRDLVGEHSENGR